MKLYAAGPITGKSYQEACRWREQVRQELWADDIEVYSPMRAKNYLDQEECIQHSYPGRVLSDGPGITARDRWDVMTCDLLLVNLLGATEKSVGTILEIAWADALRTPIVLVMEPTGNPHDHSMLRACCPFIVPTLSEAISVVRAILKP
jgi:nucleoside 2-deoxyribosyltransferase